jgi:hypothetical protein
MERGKLDRCVLLQRGYASVSNEHSMAEVFNDGEEHQEHHGPNERYPGPDASQAGFSKL